MSPSQATASVAPGPGPAAYYIQREVHDSDASSSAKSESGNYRSDWSLRYAAQFYERRCITGTLVPVRPELRNH